MALLKDKLFIGKEDFLDYKDISNNIDEEGFFNAIRESQLVELSPIIGEELYLLLQNDFTEATKVFSTATYSNLFYGEDYTYEGKAIRWRGLQPILVYYAYARLLNNAQLALTRQGPVTFTTEDDVSEATTQAQIKTKVIEARAMAKRYEEDLTKYMDTNRAFFTTWENNDKTNQPYQFIKL